MAKFFVSEEEITKKGYRFLDPIEEMDLEEYVCPPLMASEVPDVLRHMTAQYAGMNDAQFAEHMRRTHGLSAEQSAHVRELMRGQMAMDLCEALFS